MSAEQDFKSLDNLKLSPRARLLFAWEIGVCGWAPYPNQGGYDHWYCQKRRRHLGPHRFINYVAGRVFRRRVHYKPTMKSSYYWTITHTTGDRPE